MISSKHEIVEEIFSKCEGKGGHFLEHTLIGKFRALIGKINENIADESGHVRILNESEQKQRIHHLKQEQIVFYKEMMKAKAIENRKKKKKSKWQKGKKEEDEELE